MGFGDIAQNLGDYYSINKGKVYYVPNGIIYATLYGKDKNRSYEYLTKDEWKWF